MNQLTDGIEEMPQDISEKSNQQDNPQFKHVQHRKKWSLQETIKYCEFIGRHKSTLEQTEKKQKQRVYNRMSQHIGTRSTHQCRSHHQKVMKRHQSIDKFIDVFRKKLESMPRHEMSQKFNKLRFGTQKIDSNKIKQTKLNKNQPCPSIQFAQIKIQQEQKKNKQNPQTQKSNTHVYGNIKTSQKNHGQAHQEPGPLKIKLTEEIYHNSINSSERKLGWNILDSRKISNNPGIHSKVQKTIIPTSHKEGVQMQQKKLWEMQQKFEQQFSMGNVKNHDSQEISQKKRALQKTQEVDDDCFLVNRQANIILQHHGNKFKNLQNQPSYIPICQNLSNNPQSLVQNADFIFYSIIQGQNLDKINPLVGQRLIEQTPRQIKIHYKSNEYSKMWVQYRKVETFFERQKAEVARQNVEKKVSIDKLQNDSIFKRSQTNGLKLAFPPSINNLSYFENHNLPNINDRGFTRPRVQEYNLTHQIYNNFPPQNNYNQMYGRQIQMDYITTSKYDMEKVMANKKLPNTSTGDDHDEIMLYNRFRNSHNQFRMYEQPNFYQYHASQQISHKIPYQNTQQYQIAHDIRYVQSLKNRFINQINPHNTHRGESQMINRDNGFKQFVIRREPQRVNVLQNEHSRRFSNLDQSQWKMNPFESKNYK